MRVKKLTRIFFEQKTLLVAKQLLGMHVVHKTGQGIKEGVIIETEAYCGVRDLACHAAKGRTARTEVMFGPAGHAYVFLIYGMHYCFNIVTRTTNEAEAVLIRGIMTPDGRHIHGPGRVARYLGITKVHSGIDLTKGGELWIESRGPVVSKTFIEATPRIGVEYAGKYKDKKWRFLLRVQS